MSKKYYNFDDYILDKSPEVRKKLNQLRTIILSLKLDLEELINYNIPAFSLIKNGKRDQQIMIGGYDKHIGFYPGPEVVAKFSNQLSKYKFSKGAIQFSINDTIPEELIKEMINFKYFKIQDLKQQ